MQRCCGCGVCVGCAGEWQRKFARSSQTPEAGRGAKRLGYSTDNPMQPANLKDAPRCGARTRAGTECQSPAVRGRQRCRMHGGNAPGAAKGNRNAWKHGNRSAEAEEQLKTVRKTDRDLRILAKHGKGSALRSGELDRLVELLSSRVYFDDVISGVVDLGPGSPLPKKER